MFPLPSAVVCLAAKNQVAPQSPESHLGSGLVSPQGGEGVDARNLNMTCNPKGRAPFWDELYMDPPRDSRRVFPLPSRCSRLSPSGFHVGRVENRLGRRTRYKRTLMPCGTANAGQSTDLTDTHTVTRFHDHGGKRNKFRIIAPLVLATRGLISTGQPTLGT